MFLSFLLLGQYLIDCLLIKGHYKSHEQLFVSTYFLLNAEKQEKNQNSIIKTQITL